MKLTASAQNPKKVEIEITVCMTIEEWQGVVTTLGVHGHAWAETELGRAVGKALEQINKQWCEVREVTT